MKGIVMDIDHFAVHDGQGVRTCLYLKGCPLRCEWCHSPESQKIQPEVIYVAACCTSCGACAGMSRKCLASADSCPANALSVCGREMEAADVARELIEDAIFFRHSGGGVTITGGEALMQPEFTLDIASRVSDAEIPIIIETSGYGDVQALNELARLGAAFFFDIKLMDNAAHSKYCAVGNSLMLENLAALRESTDKITLRVPLIPGITDTIKNVSEIYALAVSLNINEVHLLPYNASAPAKYEWVGRPYPLINLERQTTDELQSLLTRAPEFLRVTLIT